MKIGIFVTGFAAFFVFTAQTAAAGEIVNCESRDGQRRICRVHGIGNKQVTLLSTTSRTSCEKGVSWGTNRKGIWVKRGCRGRFLLEPTYVSSGYQKPGYGRDSDNERGSRHRPNTDDSVRIKCESQNGEPSLCRVSGLRNKDVSLHRKLSSASCVKGKTWGTNKSNIWVRRGCRAIFEIRDDYDSNNSRGYDDNYWRNSHPDRYRLRGSSRY